MRKSLRWEGEAHTVRKVIGCVGNITIFVQSVRSLYVLRLRRQETHTYERELRESLRNTSLERFNVLDLILSASIFHELLKDNMSESR